MIKVIPGFKPELVAAEPLVFSPVAIDFDEDGRAYVCEMVDYPFESPQPLGRIAVLTDTNDDGVFDKRTVLADKLAWPTAVICFDGGCFVGSAPDIIYLKDTTGDGVADERKVVFTGFGKQNVQGLLNSFHWGIDNRIHGATGTNGAKIAPPKTIDTKPVEAIDLRGRDFSFDPRKLDLRPESGGAQHGMSFDDFGRKFVSSNSDHIQQVVYDDRYAAASPSVALPPARVSIAADGPQAEVFRISPVEPWRIVRTRLRVSGAVKGLVEGGGRAAGYFTGATGVTIYRGDAFPAEYRGQAFVGDVGSNLVHRKIIKPTDGVLFRAERADAGREFLASEDIWFRPAQFANAPDGTLYVLDVCREVIEHPASLPDSIKQHLDLTSGRDRGRIYRVVPDGYKHRPTPKLSTASSEQLVELLNHRNAWHREAASRLLYERQDQSVLTSLNRLAMSSFEGSRATLPEARIHALYALNSIGGSDHLFAPLGDMFLRQADRPEVLRHAVRLAEKDPRLAQDIAWITRDEPELALQRLLSIGLLKSTGAKANELTARAIADLLKIGSADPYRQAAAMAAVSGDVGDVFWQAIRDHGSLNDPKTRQMLRSLARLSAAIGKPEEMARVVKAINSVLIDNNAEAARQSVAGIVEGARLRRSGPTPEQILTGRAAELLAGLAEQARKGAADASRPIADRIADIQIVGSGPFAQAREPLSALIGKLEPAEVQVAAVAALGGYTDVQVGEVLTSAWPRLTPAVRLAAMDAIIARPDRALAFLTAIEAGRIPATDLDASRLGRLRQSKDANVRKLADTLADKSKLSPRADVVKAYGKALELKGDADKGKAVFSQSCASCHRVGDIGTEIGPNLATMKARGADAVLTNVLDPNREVNGLFVEYVVETKDGRSLSGLLAGETSAAITLLKAGGLKETIARTEVEKLRSTGLSLMPEGLERQIDPQAMADLIAFLMK
ncbi:c-type cytochrome [Humisphaera borealis]|uniref:C-type cytochrome n=1 Tax=Humisphaera borealis TaxID=2807512 RepID=A0A7M2X3E7_9BACT|nr:PVC-type heme-binding CxxCH protein [Humisphaera borealis]QOV91290.1 c-type cytochrome [Humisphaera borealis]